MLIIQQFLKSAQYWEPKSHKSKFKKVIGRISIEKLHLREPGLSVPYEHTVPFQYFIQRHVRTFVNKE